MTNWPVKTLGDIAQVGAGNSAPQDKALFENGVHRFVRTSDVGQVRIGRLGQSADLLNDEGTKGLHKFRAGVTLMPKSGASTFLNHRVQLTKPCFVSSHLAVVDPNPKIMDDTFMFYFLQTVRSQDLIQDQSYPSLNLPAISGINVLVPPLDEQKRIVALLDAATARVTELSACYERARTHANNLFTSALRDVLESNPDWPMGTLGSIFRVCSSKRVLKSEWRQTGVPFYRGREITLLSKYGIVDNELFISEDHFSELVQKYGVPKLGDIMITAIGTIGNSYIVKESDQFYFKDASVIWLDKHADIMSGYVQYWISSSKFRDQLNTGNGATVDTLTIDSLSKMQISMPPLAEQKRIVAQLDLMRAKTSEMVAAYDAKLTAAKNLRQSILEAAFAGDL